MAMAIIKLSTVYCLLQVLVYSGFLLFFYQAQQVEKVELKVRLKNNFGPFYTFNNDNNFILAMVKKIIYNLISISNKFIETTFLYCIHVLP